MKKTHYFTATVEEGNRLNISLPNVPIGETVEVILIVPQTATNETINRHEFLQLPLEERRRMLAQQAETMKDHYQNDSEWQEWVNVAQGEFYDHES
jgi:hypothetical protein